MKINKAMFLDKALKRLIDGYHEVSKKDGKPAYGILTVVPDIYAIGEKIDAYPDGVVNLEQLVEIAADHKIDSTLTSDALRNITHTAIMVDVMVIVNEFEEEN